MSATGEIVAHAFEEAKSLTNLTSGSLARDTRNVAREGGSIPQDLLQRRLHAPNTLEIQEEPNWE